MNFLSFVAQWCIALHRYSTVSLGQNSTIVPLSLPGSRKKEKFFFFSSGQDSMDRIRFLKNHHIKLEHIFQCYTSDINRFWYLHGENGDVRHIEPFITTRGMKKIHEVLGRYHHRRCFVQKRLLRDRDQDFQLGVGCHDQFVMENTTITGQKAVFFCGDQRVVWWSWRYSRHDRISRDDRIKRDVQHSLRVYRWQMAVLISLYQILDQFQHFKRADLNVTKDIDCLDITSSNMIWFLGHGIVDIRASSIVSMASVGTGRGVCDHSFMTKSTSTKALSGPSWSWSTSVGVGRTRPLAIVMGTAPTQITSLHLVALCNYHVVILRGNVT